MKTSLPPVLEVLKGTTPVDFHCVNFEGLVSVISIEGIVGIASHLEEEWVDKTNSAPFRRLVLNLLVRLATFNNLSRHPVKSEFWEDVSKSGNTKDRRAAILACNFSNDERLWNILARLWREDERGINRALALEMMGTTGQQNLQQRQQTIAEYKNAIISDDSMAKIGALHGSLFFRENSAEEIPRQVIGTEKNIRLVALAFTVLLVRNPRRAKKLFIAIMDYLMSKQLSPHETAMLLSVCTFCDPASTRRMCYRLTQEPSSSLRFNNLRQGAQYLFEHAIVYPNLLKRPIKISGCWPIDTKF